MDTPTYSCAFCAKEFPLLKTASFDREPPRVDDLLICRGCGGLSRVTLEGTVKLSDEEFKQLDKDERDALNFAIRVISQPHVKRAS